MTPPCLRLPTSRLRPGLPAHTGLWMVVPPILGEAACKPVVLGHAPGTNNLPRTPNWLPAPTSWRSEDPTQLVSWFWANCDRVKLWRMWFALGPTYVLDRWYSGEKLLMGLLVGQPLLHKCAVANGHTQHSPTLVLPPVPHLSTPRLQWCLGAQFQTLVHLDTRKPGERLLLEEDLTNAGGITEDVDVVERRASLLRAVKRPLESELRADPEHTAGMRGSPCSPSYLVLTVERPYKRKKRRQSWVDVECLQHRLPFHAP